MGNKKLDIIYEFHHIGVPTDQKNSNDRYSPQFKMYTSDGQDMDIRIQYHRFESDCPLPELFKKFPHVAFKVSNMEDVLKGRNVLFGPYFPFDGFQVAFVEIDGMSIEFIRTDLNDTQVWKLPKSKSMMYPDKASL